MKWNRQQTIAMRMRAAYAMGQPFPMPSRPPVKLPISNEPGYTHETHERYSKPEVFAASRGLDLADLLDYVRMDMVPSMPRPKGGIMIPEQEADRSLAAIRTRRN